MHLVLRSSKAKGKLSFLTSENKTLIDFYVKKFANQFRIRILGLANVGNHIHLHLKLSNRFFYKSFIRALNSAIVTGIRKLNSWIKIEGKFFDERPFTRISSGLSDFENICRYVQINILQGQGIARSVAEAFVKSARNFRRSG